MILAALTRWLRGLMARGARAVLAWSEPAPARPAATVSAGPPAAWVALVADAAPHLLDGIEPTATRRPATTARPTARAQAARIGAGLRAGPLRLARTTMSAQRRRAATPSDEGSPQDDPASDLPEPRFSKDGGAVRTAADRTAFEDNHPAAVGARRPARPAAPGRRAVPVKDESPESLVTTGRADLDDGQVASERRQAALRRRAGTPVFAPPRESGEPVTRLYPTPANPGRSPVSRLASSVPLPFARAADPAFPLVVDRHVSDPEWPELPVSELVEEAGLWTSLPESLPAVSHRRRAFAERWRAELTAE